jgi:hypothetical protein
VKFSQIAQGVLAETDATLMHRGQKIPLKLVPLSLQEESDCISAAMAYAKKKGVAAPKSGDSLFDAALWAESLALSCLDPDSDPQKRERFFDGGAAQVRSLDQDNVALLWEQQRAWQEECSPSIQAHSTEELFAYAKTIAEDKQFPLWDLSPRTRLTLLRFMASLLGSSPDFKSYFSSSSGSPPTDASKSSENSTSNSAPSDA